jgi:CHASE3 domain sensor protein
MTSRPDAFELPSSWMPAAAAPLLAVILSASAWLAIQSDRRSREIEQRLQLQNVLTSLLSGLQDAETGQRGFLLTGDESYLAPYERVRETLADRTDELARLTADNPAQAATLAELRSVLAAKLDEVGSTIERRRQGDQAGALAMVSTDRGRDLMDRARRVIASMDDAQATILIEQDAAGRRTARALVVAFSCAGLIAVAFVTVWMRSTRRYIAAVVQSKSERDRLWLLSRDLLVIIDSRGPLAGHQPGLDGNPRLDGGRARRAVEPQRAGSSG